MFRYVPRTIPTKIFVIGCGGTGSRLVPLLAQFMKTVTAGENPRGNVVDPTIYLIDDDIIENKNLARQNFISTDVGKNKAEVLAQRYGRAYGVNIIPIVKRVTPGDSGHTSRLFSDLDVGPTYPGETSLVIMCVDSAQARRDILTAWSSDRMRSSAYRRTADVPEVLPVFIDAGNEDDFGQVRIFQRATVSSETAAERIHLRKKLPAMRPKSADIHCLPMDIGFYQSMVDNEGGSCADLDQTLAINALMATLIMGMVQNLYYLKPFTYHSMSISLSGGVSVENLTAEYLIGLSDRNANAFGEMPTAFDVSYVVDQYIEGNIAVLNRMGLKKDGTPRLTRSPRQAESSQENQAPATDVEESEAETEAVSFVEGEGEEAPEEAVAVTTETAAALPSNQRVDSFFNGGIVNSNGTVGVIPLEPISRVNTATAPAAPAAPPPLRPGVVDPGHSAAA